MTTTGRARSVIVDVDRQEAALIAIGVEQRQLLAAMHDIATVVDIEDDRIRLFLVAGSPLIDQPIGEPDDVTEGWRILQARDGRLRAEVEAAVRQSAQASLKAGSSRR